ncbi:hypothetical protein D5S18_06375 [Nocardia panacis]|uniref:Uncharacterized protein n=1 Tax=Nocardia panacis TaxID=2340916 RepID=A0A3A4KFL9_9NOCA|nr:hypothetical protein [Nocardia panacis]RJO77909.1 hypothetical protein D5S18_06375 [Nocardia panacis]
MEAAGWTWLDTGGYPTARKLEFGHVGHWHSSPHDDESAPRTVAVEIDPGDGSSVVVFVHAPDRGEFHPDDQVCLVVPDAIAALYPARAHPSDRLH